MPSLSSGSTNIPLPAGQAIRFDAGGDGLAVAQVYGHPGSPRLIGAAPVTMGPYRADTVIALQANRPISWTVVAATLNLWPVMTDGANLYDSRGVGLGSGAKAT